MIRILLSTLFVTTCWPLALSGQQHEHIQTLQHEALGGVVQFSPAADGLVIYAAGFEPGSIAILERAEETGLLEFAGKFTPEGDGEPIPEDDPFGAAAPKTSGLVSIDLSSDQQWLAACSFKSRSVMLFQRERDNTLRLVDTLKQGEEKATGLGFPITVKISPDGKFIYVANGIGCLTVIKVEDVGEGEESSKQLTFLQKHEALPGTMKGSRMMSTDPTGRFFFVSSQSTGTITVFDRDEEEGHVRILHVLEQDDEDATLLAGAYGSTVSPDGKFLYLTSGRFQDSQGLSVFAIGKEGALRQIQTFENGKELEGFTGGNHVAISPDGKFVYASGATSKNVACFSRSAEDGTLEFVEYLAIEENNELAVTAGIYVSADNRFVYVAGEDKNSVFVFQRAE